MKYKKKTIFILSAILMLSYIKDHKTIDDSTTTTPTIEVMAEASKGISFYMADVVTKSMYSISEAIIPEMNGALIVTALSSPEPIIYDPEWYVDVPIMIPDFGNNH